MQCCSVQKMSSVSSACPHCSTPAQSVKVKTVKHWLKGDLVPAVPDALFYFCKEKGCPVVYFSGDGKVQYAAAELRHPLGIKDTSAPVTVCYCFDVTESMILKEVQGKGKSGFSTWIAKEVKEGSCACDVCNPSGRCCLSDVKRLEKRVA
ncbi:MAG: copper chaperone Copz family protein [Nitrospirae bacterium]|nr:copper chaperone Copz family protein [Nitrospirota bacterium]